MRVFVWLLKLWWLEVFVYCSYGEMWSGEKGYGVGVEEGDGVVGGVEGGEGVVVD